METSGPFFVGGIQKSPTYTAPLADQCKHCIDTIAVLRHHELGDMLRPANNGDIT